MTPQDAGLPDTDEPDIDATVTRPDVPIDAPSCSDGLLNASETDVDCGGPDCASCEVGESCQEASDCQSMICLDDRCAVPSCDDGLHNAEETDVDCGGPTCAPCAIERSCAVSADCASAYCADSQCAYAPDCYSLRRNDVDLPDGQYMVDVDGADGAMAPFLAQCDMTTRGGGWMLVLNYLHRGGTNPELSVRDSDLPVIVSDTLGQDGSLDPASWGHAGNALMSQLSFDETMWFGRTEAHDRVVHFLNRSPEVNAYLRTGTGSTNPGVFDPTFTMNLEAYRNAGMPLHMRANARDGLADQGDLAMTSFPLHSNHGLTAISNENSYWGIRGANYRWEVDDRVNSSSFDTLHRIWVRTNPCNDAERGHGETDVDCGGACGGCPADQACLVDGDCRAGSCDEGTCDEGTLARSCRELKDVHRGLGDGTYRVDFDGDGPMEPLFVECDMTFNGGGWTLVTSTSFNRGPRDSVEGEVRLGRTAHLSRPHVTALTETATQVHLRTHGLAETRSMTSVVPPGEVASRMMERLRTFTSFDEGDPVSTDWSHLWVGPFAVDRYLWGNCMAFETYPALYRACGNGGGLHIMDIHSRWSWAGGPNTNEPMELWVR